MTDKKKQETLIDFITRLYVVYADLHFSYLEINPLICLDGVNGGDSEPIGARVAQVVNAQLETLPRTTRGLWFDPRSCPILVVVISSLGLAWEC